MGIEFAAAAARNNDGRSCRFALFVAMVASSALAQAQTPIVQQLFSNTASATASVAVQNQGQVSHQVYVHLSNAVNCVSPNFAGALQYSFDNSTWSSFGTPQGPTSPPNAFDAVYVGTGAYNYVRFRPTSFDTTNCRLSAWYTGTFAVAPVTQVDGMVFPGSLIRSSASAWGAKPLFMGGVGTATLNAMTVCDQTTFATVTAGSTTRLQQANSAQIHVCGFTLLLSVAGTAQFVYGSGTNCGTGTTNLSPALPLLAKTPLVWGGGLGDVFAVPGGPIVYSDLCLSAVTGDAVVWVNFALIP